ncbi:MAG: cation:proton antiporter [Candidatus Micrarchaeota archaeon]|nr:cation:proton antiporter [Candidatus Micrarchaeota archaeon]
MLCKCVLFNMFGAAILFIFLAGIAFLGFIINALFDRIRITKTLPLMIIGLLIGPVFGLVSSGANSTLETLTPYITAFAIAFILFDVGLNINVRKLRRVLAKATEFTILLAVVTGIILAGIASYLLHWGPIESLIFGFALAGPSSAIVPTLMKAAKAGEDLKTALIYESVVTDSIQLVIPLLLFNLLLHAGITAGYVTSLVADVLVGSIALGFFLALIWLYILKRFKDYSKAYSWMLTISTVIATYGIAVLLNFSAPLTIFVFSIVFANLGMENPPESHHKKETIYAKFKDLIDATIRKYFYFPEVHYVIVYQREIEFFTSTFFFVYIGLLFSISNISITSLGTALIATAAILFLRFVFVNMLKNFIQEGASAKVTGRLATFNISRGLSSAIIATIPLTLGITIPGFLNQIFLIILFTNIVSTIGIFISYKAPEEVKEPPKEGSQPAAAQPSQQQQQPQQEQKKKRYVDKSPPS